MRKWAWYLVAACVIAPALSFLNAADHKPASVPPSNNVPFVRWNVQDGPANIQKKKACTEVYPQPDASKHWTDCQSGEYSRCGGPDDCACGEDDDRLIWYHCKEGSFAICEDDNTCKDGS